MTTTRGPSPATSAWRTAEAAAIARQVSATEGDPCAQAKAPPTPASTPLAASHTAPAVSQRLTGLLTRLSVEVSDSSHTGRKNRPPGPLVPLPRRPAPHDQSGRPSR